MSKPKRHQRSRAKGSRLPVGVKCVTRPGRWGNPYKSASLFRSALSIALDGEYHDGYDLDAERRIRWIAEHIDELRGLDLACWCPLDKECHADVLIEFANERRGNWCCNDSNCIYCEGTGMTVGESEASE